MLTRAPMSSKEKEWAATIGKSDLSIMDRRDYFHRLRHSSLDVKIEGRLFTNLESKFSIKSELAQFGFTWRIVLQVSTVVRFKAVNWDDLRAPGPTVAIPLPFVFSTYDALDDLHCAVRAGVDG